MLRRVVFPAPLAPIIAVTFPPLNIPVTLFRIFLVFFGLSNGLKDLMILSVILTVYEIFLKTISIKFYFYSLITTNSKSESII